MKEKDLQPRCRDTLLTLLGRVEALSIRSVKEDCRIQVRTGAQADLCLTVSAAGEDWDLIVECKQVGHPGTVRTALLQLRNYLELLPGAGPRYGILMAPFLSQESARLCEEARVGYLDLSGNARLAFGPIYIETHSADNLFRERRENRSLFTPKAGRVLRALLSPPLRPWKVTELQEAAGVSLGHVSTVRKNLLERSWAEAGDAGVQVTQPKQILRAWQEAYQPNRVGERRAYTLLHGAALETAVRNAQTEVENGAHAVYASFSAGRWLAPYARHTTQFFYADPAGMEALERHLDLEPASRGENVILWEPREDDVFSSRVEAAPGVWCTGPVQTWLDLAAAGDRGQEAADHLLREVLLPAWQGAAR